MLWAYLYTRATIERRQPSHLVSDKLMELPNALGVSLFSCCHREKTAISSRLKQLHASKRDSRQENSRGSQRETAQTVSFHVKSGHEYSSRACGVDENLPHRWASGIKPGPIPISCRLFLPRQPTKVPQTTITNSSTFRITPQNQHVLPNRLADPGDRNTHSRRSPLGTRDKLRHRQKSGSSSGRVLRWYVDRLTKKTLVSTFH